MRTFRSIVLGKGRFVYMAYIFVETGPPKAVEFVRSFPRGSDRCEGVSTCGSDLSGDGRRDGAGISRGIRGTGRPDSLSRNRPVLPTLALPGPKDFPAQSPDRRLRNAPLSRPAAAPRQNLLLNLRCQVEQVHDLSDSGARHLPQPGQFRIILDHALMDEPLELQGQCQQPRGDLPT